MNQNGYIQESKLWQETKVKECLYIDGGNIVSSNYLRNQNGHASENENTNLRCSSTSTELINR